MISMAAASSAQYRFFSANQSSKGKEVDIVRGGKGRTSALEASENRDANIYSMSEYIELQEEDFRARKSIVAKASEVLDNPFWMLWGMLVMGITVMSVVIGVRIRQEQMRFDPNLKAVRVLDTDEGPSIGGAFAMFNAKTGDVVTDADLQGKWLYIYFGFTNCPDICPDEMKKMTRVIRHLDKKVGKDYWQPIFVSIDPKRDTAEAITEYLSEFHPRIMGLLGDKQMTEEMARTFRVYYAVPDEPGMSNEDYLIDHSIIMYLMSPEGKFVDYTTKEFTWNEIYTKLLRRMMDYERDKVKKMSEDQAQGISDAEAAIVADVGQRIPEGKESSADAAAREQKRKTKAEETTRPMSYEEAQRHFVNPVNMRVANVASIMDVPTDDDDDDEYSRARAPPKSHQQTPHELKRFR
jgi:protein SCO1/2